MQRQPNGIHLGLIPEAATAGGHVEYYIEARGANGKRMTSRGSSVDPLVVTLSLPEVARSVDVAAPATVPGVGRGQAMGADAHGRNGNRLDQWRGRGPPARHHSVRLRLGEPRAPRTSGRLHGDAQPAPRRSGPPATGHRRRRVSTERRRRHRAPVAATASVRRPRGRSPCWPGRSGIFNAPGSAFRPFVSGVVGGGLIRHVAQAGDQADCGPSQNAKCFDTVPGGPFLFGPGVGFSYSLSSSLSLVVALDELIGVPKFTAETDANVGLSLRL